MSDFSVVAIVAAFNEADIINHVIRDLVHQGIQVYFLDDGSTDDTVAIVEQYLGRGVLAVDRVNGGRDAHTAHFEWERILRQKAKLATELDADWFIHHDADEFRESPWAGLSLREAIRHVDALGFNAIDFMGFDFWPVDDRFRPGSDVREALTFCTQLAPYDRLQVRCWKKAADVDLASSGGHEARFEGRRVFPLRFILRHYPVRGQAHGERKILHERLARFPESERRRGWHRQYDEMLHGGSFLRDPSTLDSYQAETARRLVAMHPRYPEELQEALCAARLEVKRLHGVIDELRDSVAQHALVIGAHEDTIAGQQAEIHARKGDIAKLVDGLDQRAEEVEQWRAAVEALSRHVDDFERSLSWRWTAPVRAAARLFKQR